MTFHRSADDEPLQSLIAEILEAENRGEAVDREALIGEHPELADSLRDFFSNHDHMKLAAGIDALTLPSSTGGISSDDPALAPNGTVGDEPTLPSNAPHAEAKPPSVGDQIRYFGDYELMEEIARGGMGVVYKARQINLNRTVALKMILAGQFAGREDVQRFYTEAEAAAQLDHPGIVPIFEIGEHAGQHYFSMGYIEGESLAQKVAAGPLPPREAAELVKKICDAMSYAHERGVIHRDLKPANVLIDANGQPKVTDFGLAKRTEADSGLTGTGQILGTPAYMPPEQASGKIDEVGPLADVYSLGAILYCLLTGRPPFQAASPMETLLQVLNKEPLAVKLLNPAVPVDLETICLKCLSKEPRGRYESAGDISSDLGRFLTGRPVSARPVSNFAKTWRWAKRNPWAAATAMLLFALSVAGPLIAMRQVALRSQAVENAVIASEQSRRANREAESAEARKKQAEDNLVLAQMNAQAEHLARAEADAALARSKYFLANAYWDAGRVRDAFKSLEEIPVGYRHLEWHLAYREFFGSDATLYGHTTSVNCVAVSPDGKHVASGSENEIRIWDAFTGKQIRVLAADGWVKCLKFFSEGQRLMSCSGNVLNVWDAETGQLISTLTETGHQDEYIWSFDLSPDEQTVVTGTGTFRRPGHLSFWNLSESELLKRIDAHNEGVATVSFSPDGKYIASVGLDRTFKLWVSESGEQILEDRGIADVEFSPDGLSLATAMIDGSWSVLALANGSLRAFRNGLANAGSQADSIALSPCGTYLAIGHINGAITVIDLFTGSPSKLQGHEDVVQDFAFNVDGSRLVSASRDQTVKLWNMPARRRLAGSSVEVRTNSVLYKEFPGTYFVNAAFSADGRRIASGSCSTDITVWDADTFREVQVLTGHSDLITSVAFSPDGTKLASACVDKTIRVWDVAESKTVVALAGHRDLITDLCFSPDGRSLASSDMDSTVKVWEVASGLQTHSLRRHDGYVYGVRFAPDGETIASVGIDGMINVWSSKTGSLIRSMTAADPVRCLAFVDDSSMLWVGKGKLDRPGEVELWDTTTGKRIRSFLAGDRGITSLSLDPNSKYLLTSDHGGSIKLWDLRTGQELRSYQSRPAGRGSVLFSPTAPLFAYATYSSQSLSSPSLWNPLGVGRLFFWDADDGHEVAATYHTPLEDIDHAASSENSRKVIAQTSGKHIALHRDSALTSADNFSVIPPSSNSSDGHYSVVPFGATTRVIDLSYQEQPQRQSHRDLWSRANAYWHRERAFSLHRSGGRDYAVAAHLAWWIQQAPDSDPMLPEALSMLSEEVDEWEALVGKANEGNDSINTGALLPSAVTKSLATNPRDDSLPSAQQDLRDERLQFVSELSRWTKIQEQLVAAANHQLRREYAKAREVYQRLLEEIRRLTDDPLETVGHVVIRQDFRVSLCSVYDKLAKLELAANEPAASALALNKLRDALLEGLDRDNPYDWQELGDVCFRLEDWQGTRDAYQKAFALVGEDSPTAERATDWWRLTLALARLEEVERAKGYYEKLAQLDGLPSSGEQAKLHDELTELMGLLPATGEFSPWLSEKAFLPVQQTMTLMRGRPPKVVEGRWLAGVVQYRAKFALTGVKWTSCLGKTDSEYHEWSSENRGEGFLETSHHSFVDDFGETFHCAIWSRLPSLDDRDHIEGELMYWESLSNGKLVKQDMTSWKDDSWSGDQQLLWLGPEQTDSLSLGFWIEVPGDYEIAGVLTKAPDFAIANLILDEDVLASNVDSYDPRVRTSEKMQFGTYTLTTGRHNLSIEIKGRNSSNVAPSLGFGLDYIELKKN